MKKSILAILLAVVMVASLLPMAALAGDDTIVAAPTAPNAPTGNDSYFFANGVPIMITATAPTGGTEVTLKGFTATGGSAYISWTVNGATSYVGVSENTQVFGGADGRTKAVTVASTSITMTGGRIHSIYGGNYGMEAKTADTCSVVTGNVELNISNNADVYYVLHGGGKYNCAVNGTVYMNFNNATMLGDMEDYLYVNCGNNGNGSEGTRDIADGEMITYAVVNNAVVNAVNSNIALFGAGGSGSTKVNSATVKMTNCKVEVFFVGGINGELKNCDIELVDCEIGSFAGTNRGFVGTADVGLVNCNIGVFETGASAGCFTSDSGVPDGSGITGSVSYTLDENCKIGEAVLTPTVTKTSSGMTGEINNLVFNNYGEQVDLTAKLFSANEDDTDQNVSTFIVPNGSTVELSGANVEVTSGQTLTNMGVITLDSDKTITVAAGATYNDGGETNATVVGDESNIHKYVAKVGNTGYDSLADAMTAVVADGGTLYVLKDCELTSAQYSITKDVTINGGGHDVKVTVAEGVNTRAFDIKNGASLVLDGVNMTIYGTKNSSLESKNDGTAIGIGNNSTFRLTGDSILTLNDLNRGFTMDGGASAKFIISNGSFNVNTVDGNLTNGGTLEFTKAYVNVDDCGDYGFSVNDITLTNSTVNITKVGCSAIFSNSGGLTLKNSDVNISNCGSKLPKTDGTAADYVIDYKDNLDGMDVTVDKDSSLRLTRNNNNSVNVGERTFRSAGTFVGNVVVNPETTCVVTVEYNGIYTVGKNTKITLPAAPSKSGYAFLGWSDSTNTYPARSSYTVTKNVTFTASWVRHSDVPYVPEPDEPSEPVTPVFPFYDVSTSAWYYSAVKYVYDNGLMDGVDTYVFAPNDTLTRAMVWTIIARMSGVDTTGGANWYAKAQEWVVVNGISDGENPTAAITREQLVTMLHRYAQIKGYDVSVGENTNILSYVDATSISEYAVAAFQWSCGSGLTEGDENGALTPLATATRAQAAAMIMRFCQSVK